MKRIISGSHRRGRRLRVEPLEQRFLLSVGSSDLPDGPVDSQPVISSLFAQEQASAGLVVLQLNAAPSAAADLGVVDFLELTDQRSFSGELWYQLEARRHGILTVELTSGQFAEDTQITLYEYDGSGNLRELAADALRIDYDGTVGTQRYIVRVTNIRSAVDLRLANLVQVELLHAGQVRVADSAGGDWIEFTAGTPASAGSDPGVPHVLSINGLVYEFDPGRINDVRISQAEHAVVTGSDGADTLELSLHYQATIGWGRGPETGYAKLRGDWGEVTVSGNSISVVALGGYDRAVLHATVTDVNLVASPGGASFAGQKTLYTASGFESLEAHIHRSAGATGLAVAHLYDSHGDDTFTATPTYGKMEYENGEIVQVEGFDAVHAYAKAGGRDVASLYDSAGGDTFVGRPTLSKLFYGDGSLVRAKFFDAVHAYAKAGGHDVASLYDSPGDDTFVGTPTLSKLLYDDGSLVRTKFFDAVHAYAKAGGDDVAYLHDSAADDRFVSNPEVGKMTFGDGCLLRAKFFDKVSARASQGGQDVAHMYGSKDRDTFVATPIEASMSGNAYHSQARLFESVVGHAVDGGDGADSARLYDSPGDDTFVGRRGDSELSGEGFTVRARHFEDIDVRSKGHGYDVAHLYDSPGFDWFEGEPGYSQLGPISVTRFDVVNAVWSGCDNDGAVLSGSYGSDRCVATPDYVELAGDGYLLTTDFPYVDIYAWGGHDSALVYDTPGDDYLMVWSGDVELQTDRSYRHVYYDLCNFAYVEAHSSNPGDSAYIAEPPTYELVLEGYWEVREL